ncbi:hypothetical protein P23_0985 [Acinetobacter calcoaceticus]|nr:hypothetical protein P23_0985 [Acinetobacter calcoaceticus]
MPELQNKLNNHVIVIFLFKTQKIDSHFQNI